MSTSFPLSLENYEEFVQNPQQRSDMTFPKLNKILKMHGFVRSIKAKKNEVLDSLSSICLMPPRRSTLMENVSSLALLSLEEVKKDIEALGWQQCDVQTIQITRTGPMEDPSTGDVQTICASSDSGPGSCCKRKKRKKKTESFEEIALGPVNPPVTASF